MSYTMTMELPQKTAAYVERKGKNLHDELQALFIAFIQTRMQYDDEADSANEKPGRKLLSSFREGDRIVAGKKKVKWYKSAEQLVADCLA